MEFTIHYYKYRTMQLNSYFVLKNKYHYQNLVIIYPQFIKHQNKQLNKKGNHNGVCCMKRWLHFNISTLVHVCVL